MQYEIFYNTIYPSIKASLEAKGIITVDKYEPATDFDGLDKFAMLPFNVGINRSNREASLLEVDNYIEKVLKECNIPYTKSAIDFRMPFWYRYELILD